MPSKAQLPSNIDAERTILGLILADADRYLPDVRGHLAADDFSLERHRRIYRHALELDSRHVLPDIVTVTEELRRYDELEHDGMAYLSELVTMPRLTNISNYVGIIKDLATRRRLIFKVDDLGKLGRLKTTSTPELIKSAEAFFRELQVNANGREPPPLSVPQWPELRPEAMYGVAGDVVRALEEHTESDPVAILMQTLVGFGSLIGRTGYYAVEGDRHHTNLYLVIAGVSSKARKGTSWSRTRGILSMVDEHWAEHCLLSGIGSGEALIDALDVDDRRRLIIEGEFARVLAVMQRDGQTMSPILRTVWDSGRADIQTRLKERHVRDSHLSLIAHITIQELVRRLDSVEMANGLANRVLFCCARRSKLLPNGGGSPEVGKIARSMLSAVEYARKVGQSPIGFDEEAKDIWESVYAELSAGHPGMLGSVTSRSEAQTIRLSLIYALLDGARSIRAVHLRAGLAVWHYCEASAAYIFGNKIGDPIADKVLAALKADTVGMTRTDISRAVFKGNRSVDEMDPALNLLIELGLVRTASEETAGRSALRFFAA